MPVGWLERVLHSGRVIGSGWATRRGPWARACYEFLVFGIKQAWACAFGGALLALLVLTHFFYPAHAPLARYDFLVIAAVLLQLVLLFSGMENRREALVILIYHVVGTAMEVFKTSVGSWSYPEESVLRIAEVPLFSGFMYAAVGSYLARVWRLFDFRFVNYPRQRFTVLLAGAIYINFFTHHVAPDMRWLLFGLTAILYGRTWVRFRIEAKHRSMPLLLGFVLVATFIWLAENIGTFARAWSYPAQSDAWEWVSPAKLGSWLLLMIVSFVLVSLVHVVRGEEG